MGWEQVWSLVLTRFSAEDIQVRILVGLAVAFFALMILEGLRACFFPPKRRNGHEAAPVLAAPRLVLAAPPPAAPGAKSDAQPIRVRKQAARAIPKRKKRPLRAKSVQSPKFHRPKHGAMRRIPNFAENPAPYSPLSPNR